MRGASFPREASLVGLVSSWIHNTTRGKERTTIESLYDFWRATLATLDVSSSSARTQFSVHFTGVIKKDNWITMRIWWQRFSAWDSCRGPNAREINKIWGTRTALIAFTLLPQLCIITIHWFLRRPSSHNDMRASEQRCYPHYKISTWNNLLIVIVIHPWGGCCNPQRSSECWM